MVDLPEELEDHNPKQSMLSYVTLAIPRLHITKGIKMLSISL